MHIPKKTRKKLDEHTWQGIHVGYDSINQYRILNPRTGKVYVIRDIHFDELHIYNKKGLLPVDFENEKWAPSNDELFVDITQLILSNNKTPDDAWDIPIPRPTDAYGTPPYTPLGGADNTGDTNLLLEEIKDMKFAQPSEAHRFAYN